ncbi:MAG TPA: ferrochelatase [Polyangiaceae bacterium]|nr:ferrochelatase [Polyangiaceae bacterium]
MSARQDVAVVVVSHGTVDDLEDLGPFVANVRRGRPAPPELIAELRRRYEAIGGSPLNRINAEIASKLAVRLGVPVVAANRLWRPFVRDVLAELAGDGVKRVAVVPLAQHSAHVYADDAKRAAEGTGLEVACAPAWGGRDDLCAAFAARIVAALGAEAGAGRTTLLMTAHSLPKAVVDAGDPYEREVRASADAIAQRVRRTSGEGSSELPVVVAFQSQGMAGAAPIAWLGPDLRAALDAAKGHGSARVVLAPVGFLADHVEVLYDLDIEARALAAERGLAYARAASLNADGDFIEVLAAVARPLLAGAPGR